MTNKANSKADVSEMVQQYKLGKTLAEIGSKFGVSVSYVHQSLKSQGVSRKDKGAIHAPTQAEINRMIAQHWGGKTLAELADENCLSLHQVKTIMQDNDISKRGPRAVPHVEPDRLKGMIDAYMSGKTYAQVGEEYGFSQSSAYKILANQGVTKKTRDAATGGRNDRVKAMIAMYKSGKTLAEIAKEVGLARQRVHQIFKDNGISSEGHGAKVRTKKRADEKQAWRASRIKEIWDLTMEEYKTHVAKYGTSTTPGSPMQRYVEHRRNAGRDNTAWEFTFRTWWEMWETSGKWEERGVGKYVLGREGDASVPMSPKTCRITTVSEMLTGDFFNRNR